MGPGRTKKLHSDEKILLFISEFSALRELWDVPPEVTQKGISRRMDILENNVSRSLKRLLREGMVRSELKHVKGEKRRQKAYFLTRIGEEQVSRIKERLENLSVEVLTDGELIRMSLPSAKKKAKEVGASMTLAEIYLQGRNRELPLDLSPDLLSYGGEEGLLGNFQMPLHFYGREKEIEAVNGFLLSRAGVLVIWGLAGIGKTSLILKSLSESRKRCAYIRCEPWTDRIEFVNELSSLLLQMGMEEESQELSGGEVTPGQLSRSIKGASRKNRDMVIVIDDLQKTGGGIDIYVEGLCRTSMETPGLKVVLLTRERPSFLDPRFELHDNMRSLQLKGLEPQAVAMMLKEQGKSGDIGSIWEITKGHPLFIELFTSSLEIGARSRFGEFLEKEVLSVLPQHQKKGLSAASLAGLPVHRSLMTRMPPEDLDILKRKGLLKEVSGSLLFVHDLISDHILSSISQEERDEMLKDVVSYKTAVSLRVWADGPELLAPDLMENEMRTPKFILSRISDHFSTTAYEDEPGLRELFQRYLDSLVAVLVDIGRKGFALNILTSLSKSTGKGRGKALLGSFMRLERSKLSDDHLFKLRVRRAYVEAMEGNYSTSSSTLELIEATYPLAKIGGGDRALIQHIKGRISKAEKRYDQTILSHNEALSTYQRMEDRKAAAKERLHLAKALYQNGDFEGALKESIKSASDYEAELDRIGEVHACLQASRSASALGKEGRASMFLNRAWDVSSSISDPRLMLMVEIERIEIEGDFLEEQRVRSFLKLCSHVGERDRTMAVKGILKVIKEIEGIAQPELILKCVKEAALHLEGHFRGSSKEPPAEMEGSASGSSEIYMLKTQLLEEELELLQKIGQKKAGSFVENGGFPYTKGRAKDMKGELLMELISACRDLITALKREMGAEEADVSGFHYAYEGAIHSLLSGGIHFRDTGNRKRARELFRECRKVICEYERSLSDMDDQLPAFDLRKVKEVLEENRVLLEGSHI
ncbi:MAG: AAA family ATPase [Thermoplasmatota archaeon]